MCSMARHIPLTCSTGAQLAMMPRRNRSSGSSPARRLEGPAIKRAAPKTESLRLWAPNAIRFGGPVVPLVSIFTAMPPSPVAAGGSKLGFAKVLSSARSMAIPSAPLRPIAAANSGLARSLRSTMTAGRRNSAISASVRAAGCRAFMVTMVPLLARTAAMAWMWWGRLRRSMPNSVPGPSPDCPMISSS